MPRLERTEVLRQVVHIGSGLLAFLVGWLGPSGTVALALGATAFNLWLLPRIAPLLLRPTESRTLAIGVVSYPLSVLALALAFGGRPEVVAAAWGVLAFGDGLATLIGRATRFSPLPWNDRKSWAGSFAYWLFGSLAAAALLLWVSPDSGDARFLWAVCGVVVLGSALLESLPLRLDDNLVVPLLTGLGFALLLETEGAWSSFPAVAAEHWVAAVAANTVFGTLAYLTGGVGSSGLAGGVALGTGIYLALGLPGWAVLVVFYALGTGTTRVGLSRKRRAGLAQENRGRRSVRNVLANGAVPMICAVLAVTHSRGDLMTACFVAALAAAAGDTVSSEIGQLVAGRTRLVTTLRRVPAGTEGGVSLVGTAAGALGAVIVVAVGVQLALIPQPWALSVAVAAVAAVFVDSLLGAALERRGLLDNEAVNFGATLSAALLAYWLLGLAGR